MHTDISERPVISTCTTGERVGDEHNLNIHRHKNSNPILISSSLFVLRHQTYFFVSGLYEWNNNGYAFITPGI
jgi:hypothetical protein